jgi:hypothetical protein
MANRIKRLRLEAACREKDMLFRRLLVKQKQKSKAIKLTPAVAQKLIRAQFKYRSLSISLKKRNVKKWCSLFSKFINEPTSNSPSLYHDVKPLEILTEVLAHKGLREIIRRGYFRVIANIIHQGEVIRPLSKWKAPNTNNVYSLCWSLFSHTCVRYPDQIPFCIKKTFDYNAFYYVPSYNKEQGRWIYCVRDLNILFHFVSGKGLHHFEDEFRYTKKMNYHFLKLPNTIEDLHKGLILSFLGAWGLPKVFFPYFMEGLNLKDVMESEQVIRFLVRQKNLNADVLNRVFTFYAQQTFDRTWVFDKEIEPLFPNFSFKKRTLNSVLRMVDEWDRWLAFHKNKILSQAFILSDKNDFAIDNYRISQVKTPLDLVKEGDAMKHCVTEDYMIGCIEGNHSIWSVWEIMEAADITKRLATISVCKENKVDEFKAKCNAEPKNHVVKLVEQWAKMEEIEFDMRIY